MVSFQYPSTPQPRSAKRQRQRRTNEDPLARLRVQALHLRLVRLTLVRELLRTGTVASRVRGVALLKALSHLAALVVRARAQALVVRILLVLVVQILRETRWIRLSADMKEYGPCVVRVTGGAKDAASAVASVAAGDIADEGPRSAAGAGAVLLGGLACIVG